jgi:serine/threonine protein kinase
MNERPRYDETVDHQPSGASVLLSLTASLPEVPRVHLRDPLTDGITPVNLPDSSEMTELKGAPNSARRLHLLGEIARGGMGAILKARDVDLGRDLVVKVLLEAHQGRPEMVQRFIEEAQISGQLQHPGIAPVHELGMFPDGRPYFTMKLVKGQTLSALLRARKDEMEDRPRFLGIFAQMCQTLAYAHARGVIHRDLKPSNVMVGAYGEVQVMDWGLAKVLMEGGVADEVRSRQREREMNISVIRTARSQESDSSEAGSHTLAGTLLGTPAYMAPEQARGDLEMIDERADVFGLGAILCETLTGKPPYTGKEAEIQYKARTGKLDDAFGRLDSCGADAELIALTKRCLAAEPWDRLRHAGEVAEQVTAYQNAVAERLRQAELAKAAEEARVIEARATAAQERKARRMTVALAATVFVVLSLGGGFGLWLHDQYLARKLAEKQKEVDAHLRFGAANILSAPSLASDEFQKVIELDPKNVEAYHNLGVALWKQGKLDEAIAACRTAIELSPLYPVAHDTLASILRDHGQPDAAIAEHRKAIELAPKIAESHSSLGYTLYTLGRLEEAAGAYREAKELGGSADSQKQLRRCQRLLTLGERLQAAIRGEQQPADAELRLDLADLCYHLKRYARCVRLYADAFAADGKLADDMKALHRYNAACNAALAGCGRGIDANNINDKERARLRQQALDWLRADLAAYGKLLEGGKTANRFQVQQQLQHWRLDTDLVGVRDAKELANLPAAERQAWEKLWTDVATMLKRWHETI